MSYYDYKQGGAGFLYLKFRELLQLFLYSWYSGKPKNCYIGGYAETGEIF